MFCTVCGKAFSQTYQEKDANGEGGVKYKPFDLEFSASKYSIKRMYINNKIIYFK